MKLGAVARNPVGAWLSLPFVLVAALAVGEIFPLPMPAVTRALAVLLASLIPAIVILRCSWSFGRLIAREIQATATTLAR